MEHTELQLFEKAAFGVFRTDLSGRILYANAWINALVGRPLTSGLMFRDVVSDTESLKTLDEEIRKRLAGHSGEYVLTIDTATRPLQVQVFGTPVLNEHGEVVGAVAFVTRAPLDRVRDALLSIRISQEDPLSALGEMREVLESFYSFDAFVVSMYDASMEYSRVLHTFMRGDTGDPERWSKHWVKLSPDQRQWILDSDVADRAIPDLEAFMRDPRWVKMNDNPFVRLLWENGIRSAAGVSVKEGDTVVATVSLLSRRGGAYDEELVRELHQLPIDRRVFAIVNVLRAGETAFRYGLLRHLAKCKTVDELANSVVRSLCSQYKLARVALYSVERVEGQARLQSERTGCSRRVPSETFVPLDSGVVGKVAHSAQPEYVEDLRQDPHCQGCFKETQGSLFSWPVAYYREGGGRAARWVFVAIDERPAAFSPDERAGLMEIAVDIGGLLARLTELHFMRSTFDTTSDAILVVDSRHEVRRANEAAAELFGCAKARDVQGPLSSFFADPQEAEAFMGARPHRMEAQIKDAEGASIPAMVSSRLLPPSIGGKVFALEDLRNIRRLEELSFLGRVTSEISVQMQTPLTLASSWLARIGSIAAEWEARESFAVSMRPGMDDGYDRNSIAVLAERTLVQLRRIQGCLDQVALYDSKGAFVPRPGIPLSLDTEVARLVQSLPPSEQARIQLSDAPGNILVSVHPEHLQFVMDTLLAYFLRYLPSAAHVAIETGHDERVGWLMCEVRGISAESTAPSPRMRISAMTTELGIARRALQQILRGYGGDYQTPPPQADGRVSFARIVLPLLRSGYASAHSVSGS